MTGRAADRSAESGNVLFLILIAVALFAALSYATTSGNRSSAGKNNINAETTALKASQIMQYATYIEQTVMKMRLRGVSDEALCFDSDAWGHNDYDQPSCVDSRNSVYLATGGGGGGTWAPPPGETNDGSPWYISGEVCVPGIGTFQGDACDADGISSSEDLTMILPGILKDVCIKINEKLGIPNPGGLPPVDSSGSVIPAGEPKFTGVYADGEAIDSGGGGGDPATLRHQTYGCAEAPAGVYNYYHVLIAR